MWKVLAAIAVGVQAILLLSFVGMGLGWTGVWWYATLLQAAAGLALAVIALAKKPPYALVIPVASFALMLLFNQISQVMAARICSPEVIDAANELGPIPGFGEQPDYLPEVGEGCVGRFNSPRPPAEVIEHYRLAGTRAGWTLATPQPTGHAVMHKGALSIEVWQNTRNDHGMYIIRVH